MKKLKALLLTTILTLLMVCGLGMDKIDASASTNTHKVTFDYNISRIDDYIPQVSAVLDSLETYTIDVENGGVAEETRKLIKSITACYSYSWSYNGTLIADLSQFEITKDVTLVAQWTPKTFRVYFTYGNQYELDEAVRGEITNLQEYQEYTIESPRTVLYRPNRPHYEFVGWYIQNENIQYSYIQPRSQGDRVVGARFVPVSYNINYHMSDGENPNKSSYTVEDKDIVLFDAERYGYEFKGWFSDTNYENRIYTIDTSKGGEIDVYPLWEAKVYTVTYIMPDGSSKSVEVFYGEDAELPKVQKSIFEIVRTNKSRKNITENTVIKLSIVNIWYVYVLSLIAIAGIVVLIVLIKKKRHNTHNKLRVVYHSNSSRKGRY
ncbi:MAG: InlB B-repeat-containing protein [Clostridia bacterium]|nr:InlB B-repeat-containing protein [Clostridia bacterium]